MPNCDFPSTALIAYSRRLAREADQIPEDRARDISLRMQAVLKIHQLRHEHEDIDGCNCWYTALKTMPPSHGNATSCDSSPAGEVRVCP